MSTVTLCTFKKNKKVGHNDLAQVWHLLPSAIHTMACVINTIPWCPKLFLNMLLDGFQIYICWPKLSGASLNRSGGSKILHKIKVDSANRLSGATHQTTGINLTTTGILSVKMLMI